MIIYFFTKSNFDQTIQNGPFLNWSSLAYSRVVHDSYSCSGNFTRFEVEKNTIKVRFLPHDLINSDLYGASWMAVVG